MAKRKIRTDVTGSKVEQYRDIKANNTIASNLAKKTRDFPTIDSDRAYSNKRSGENKHSYGMLKLADRVCTIQLIINIDRENHNCYNYGRFGYLARNCRNKGTGGRIRKSRRLKYRGNK